MNATKDGLATYFGGIGAAQLVNEQTDESAVDIVDYDDEDGELTVRGSQQNAH